MGIRTDADRIRSHRSRRERPSVYHEHGRSFDAAKPARGVTGLSRRLRLPEHDVYQLWRQNRQGDVQPRRQADETGQREPSRRLCMTMTAANEFWYATWPANRVGA